MPENCVSVLAVCPYYLDHTAPMIRCEGVQDGSVLHLAFANAKEQLRYRRDFCENDYKSCRICRMLNGKYELTPSQN